MSKLILHIGSHKTGTTSIQNALRNWQESHDRPQNASFVDIQKGPLRIGRIRGEGADFKATIKPNAFQKALAQGSELTIMSTEFFSWLIHGDQEVRATKQLIDQHFDDVKIVVYLRRQDLAANAHQNQVRLLHPAANAFGIKLAALPEWSDNLFNYFDYASRMQTWIDVFGIDRINVRVFERDRLVNGDAVADFAKISGIDLSKVQSETRNLTAKRNEMLLGLAAAKAGINGPLQRKSFGKFNARAPKLLPSREEAETFLLRFEQSNSQLEKMFNTTKQDVRFSSDMSMYPEEQSFTKDHVERLRTRFSLMMLRATGQNAIFPSDLDAHPDDDTFSTEDVGKLLERYALASTSD